MTEVAFYHLTRQPLEVALPKLLEKTLAAGKRALVVAGSELRVESLVTELWTHDAATWLPHGSAKDGQPDHQPIWLSTSDENVNGAQFLFLTEGVESTQLANFERCFDLFDGNDDQAVAAARQRWVACKEAGHTLAYWRQKDNGGWEKSA